MNDHPTPAPEPSLSEVQARAASLGWTVYPVFGGYLAAPAGVTVIITVHLSSLLERLERQP